MDLAEFVLARVAEDEGRAPRYHRLLCLRTDYAEEDESLRVCTCGYPARVLAECEAKRQAVAYVRQCEASVQPFDADANGEEFGASQMLKYLALPYADHPDYRPEWRP